MEKKKTKLKLKPKGVNEIYPDMMTLLKLVAHCPTTKADVERIFNFSNLLSIPLRASISESTMEQLT